MSANQSSHRKQNFVAGGIICMIPLHFANMKQKMVFPWLGALSSQCFTCTAHLAERRR